jgi:integrase
MGKLNGTNPNHPKKGSRITVDPIRADKDIKKIKRLLKDNTRDLLLFTMGINNGLRISDLLKLKVGDVRDIKPGQTLKVKETKTGKMNILMINKSVHKVLKQYLEEVKPSDEDYLFQSRNGNNKPLTRETVNKMIKEWTKSLKGNYGDRIAMIGNGRARCYDKNWKNSVLLLSELYLTIWFVKMEHQLPAT